MTVGGLCSSQSQGPGLYKRLMLSHLKEDVAITWIEELLIRAATGDGVEAVHQHHLTDLFRNSHRQGAIRPGSVATKRVRNLAYLGSGHQPMHRIIHSTCHGGITGRGPGASEAYHATSASAPHSPRSARHAPRPPASGIAAASQYPP